MQSGLSEPERELQETVWDDAYALFELGRPAFTSHRPDGEVVIVPTNETIEALLSKGLVRLSRLRYQPKVRGSREWELTEETVVPDHDARTVLADPVSWEKPSQSTEPYFGA